MASSLDTTKYFVSAVMPRGPMSVQVNVRDGKIVWTARVAEWAIGKPLDVLVKWMKADVVEEIGREL